MATASVSPQGITPEVLGPLHGVFGHSPVRESAPGQDAPHFPLGATNVVDISQYTGNALQGFGMHRKAQAQNHKRRVREASRLYADVLQGREHPFFLQQAMNPTHESAVMYLAEKYPGLYGNDRRMVGMRETMSISDYQALTVDVLDRLYYGYYNAYPIPNKVLTKVHPLRDFRTVSRYMLDGMVSPYTAINPAAPATRNAMTGPVPQDGASASVATTAPIQYAPLAYQSETAVDWSARVNDDLGIFNDLANRLAIQGNRGINRFITSQYVDTNGPSATLYKTAYRNLITIAFGAATNNPPFSAQGVSDGFKVLAGMLDSDGNPIMMGNEVLLWFGPSLYTDVMNFLNANNANISVLGGTQAGSTGFPAYQLQINNWMAAKVTPVMDPYIPIVCTHATKKYTSWGMTINPNSVARPSIELGFLSGYETPQIYRKLPNTMRIGGGVDEAMGDFYSMASEMKIVGVMGAAQLDGRTAIASDGSGT